MIDSPLHLLFFCAHRKTTFPLTIRRDPPVRSMAPRPRGTYVVCLECGKQFPYNWETLRVEPHASGSWYQPLSSLMCALMSKLGFHAGFASAWCSHKARA